VRIYYKAPSCHEPRHLGFSYKYAHPWDLVLPAFLQTHLDGRTTVTMVDLPDPTSDLDWSGFVGPIHEIFHKNALAHPDRACVTETKSST
jgi:hypothetical protein